MMDLTMGLNNRPMSPIIRPTITAASFEIPHSITSMVRASQFGGLPLEDPNTHLETFLDICDLFNQNGVLEDAVRLRLFPFYLRDKARAWLASLQSGSITTWDEMMRLFLAKIFPPAKVAKMKNEITSFTQYENESLYEAWERFRDMLTQCPSHGLSTWQQFNTFYTGMNPSTRSTIDTATGGSLMRKTPDQAYRLIDKMATSSFQYHSERHSKRPTGARVVDNTVVLSAQMDVLMKKLDNLMHSVRGGASSSLRSCAVCEHCGGDSHASSECQVGNPFAQESEEAHYVGNYNRQRLDPYSNTYNPGWRNHPNFSWWNDQVTQPQSSNVQRQPPPPPGFKAPNPAPPEKSNLEKLLSKYISTTEVRMQNQESSIRYLENQMSQIANLLKERLSGSLPNTTEANPREHAKAIVLRSGKQLEEVQEKQKDKEVEKSEEDESQESGKEATKALAEKEYHPRLFADPITHPVRPRIPYPQRLKAQMPSYVKFLKENLSNKRRLEEYAMVKLNEECSAILSRKLPPKLKDPGSFTIPSIIGDLNIDKALMDLGASINLMPLSVFRKLGLVEPKPTTISLQLADRSITYPRGIIEDVLVKVEKFIFLVDFLVLDMEEDIDILIILRRPFMATARTIIDVQRGKLSLRLQDEELMFDVFNAMKHPSTLDSCHFIDIYSSDTDDSSTVCADFLKGEAQGTIEELGEELQ
ncbi:hypothetical protein K2173_023970 [Erythroxylum novogranatense]|uniref:Retrotransposon gag domain-containing protein n=1 Tax=Erythroxylum novogranatense TaxID=1862640 RepID=A0AAV8TSR4_9ROSI|nr:hypothetical protein K2173_023970 [Erythroxylum novogranatense]